MTMKETKRQMLKHLRIMQTTSNLSDVTNSYIKVSQLEAENSFIAFMRYSRLASRIYKRRMSDYLQKEGLNLAI